MYCSKCGAEIVTGGKFCSECGTKVETRCSSCKTVLADTAKFCHVCGTKVGNKIISQQANINSKMDKQLHNECIEHTKMLNNTINISEKRNRMVYVEDKGLYYIAAQSQICFVESGQTKIKKLTKKSDEVIIDGLGYYNGELLYWYQRINDERETSELRAMNIHTLEKRKVKKFVGWDLSLISTHCVFVFKNDRYYVLNCMEQAIWEISVADSNVVKRTLPLMQYESLPEDWRDFFERDEKIKFNSFLTVNEYGYASIEGACQFTIRFKLNNPDDFVCMPMISCTAQPFSGVIIEHNNKIYSCSPDCYPDHFYSTQIVNNKAVSKILLEREKWLYKTYVNSMRSWWKLGEQYILGSIVMDTAKHKFYVKQMSDLWERALDEIVDFVEDENGNVYLLEYYGDVYMILKTEDFYAHEPGEYLIKYN